MKCLIVTTLERQILLFLIPHIQLLQDMGYHVSIATSIEDKDTLQEKVPNVSLYNISFSRSIQSLSNFRAYLELKSLFHKESFDLVHVHTPIASFVARLAAPKKVPIVYTAHGFHFNENGSKLGNRIFYLAEKLAGKKTQHLIVMNQEDYQKAQGLLDKERIHFIHGIGVDTDYYNPRSISHSDRFNLKEKLGIEERKLVITHLAEFNENKRQIDIVQAAEQLKDAYQDFIILLVGDGTLFGAIKQEINRRGLSDFFRCLGFRQDIREILSITDVGLLVSLREGLPKSLMEMMAMEIPIVVTDIRGSRELVRDGKNGFRIPIKSPNELKNKLLYLLKSQSLRNRMGDIGRQEVLAKYDLKLILEETKSVYERIQVRNLNKAAIRTEEIQSIHYMD
ncbi:glycosyltransferase family 4 protein [Ornithinibacillus sp. BX22]|uniref:Glycosyltransferase family 4 protein n=2 Tax=Ornithinibacillus TaxID=484508 RepID=A0A923L7V7_9BACI|nr:MULTISPECIES: glycosyltransferase family 4 protein [Ornithinibacillus]MBC5637991.1 glycosyltransferase family 4 protein [Ornithinibacillus hominis]MBS3681879.1 glycosyltransferase family 4 protein [Ornithinibacillus massiliensis]